MGSARRRAGGAVKREGRLTFMNAEGEEHKLATRATYPFLALPEQRLLTRSPS